MAKKAAMTMVSEEGIFVEFEVVERPLNTRNPWAITPQVEQIVTTVESGKAYRAKFKSAADLKKIQMALRHAISQRQLSMHYSKQADDTLLIWADKKKS